MDRGMFCDLTAPLNSLDGPKWGKKIGTMYVRSRRLTSCDQIYTVFREREGNLCGNRNHPPKEKQPSRVQMFHSPLLTFTQLDADLVNLAGVHGKGISAGGSTLHPHLIGDLREPKIVLPSPA